MRRTPAPIVLVAVVSLLLLTPAFVLTAPSASQSKLPLHILYAGRPGAERTADFVGFLKDHFREVDTADLKQLRLDRKLDADVILLDYDGDGFKAPRVTFPKGYSKPTITIGVAGALICDGNTLKTGYL